MTEEQRKELERKISVMQAYLDGAMVESRLKNAPECWETLLRDLVWNWSNCDYRVKQTKPSINWEHVSDEFNMLCVDVYGQAWLDGIKVRRMRAEVFTSFKRGTCNYRDSRVVRLRVDQHEPEE